MRFIDRVVLFLLSLMVIAIGAGAILLCFDITEATNTIGSVLSNIAAYRWFILIGGAVLVIIGVIVIFACAFHSNSKGKTNIVNTMEQGESVQISVNAINCIIQQLAKSYPTVSDVKTTIRQNADGVNITVSLVADSNANFPVLAADLQNIIKNQLENMAGLKVSGVKIVVSDVNEKPIEVSPTDATTGTTTEANVENMAENKVE